MAEEEQQEGEEKKSSKLIIIIAAVVLLLVAAGSAYYFLAAGDSVAETEQTGQAEEEKAAEEESAVSEQIYYAMDQSLIVNFPKNPVASLIQVSVTLLVKDAETVEALKKHEPMIRNNLLMKISAKGASKLQSREGKEELRSEMLDEVNQVMELMTKKNNVENIFFTAFVMQ